MASPPWALVLGQLLVASGGRPQADKVLGDILTLATRSAGLARPRASTPQACPDRRHHGASPLAEAICRTPLRSQVRRFESFWGHTDDVFEPVRPASAGRTFACRPDSAMLRQEWT